MELQVLHEDEHIIVVIKPAGVPSQRDLSGDKDMTAIITEYLGADAKGSVFVVHRLDRPVSGVMVYAKTKEASAGLTKQIQEHDFSKHYMAVVCGRPEKQEDELRDYLIKRHDRAEVAKEDTPGSKLAILRYQCKHTIENMDHGVLSLLDIELQTGRYHQIRVQMKNAGLPIWGDTKYNLDFAKRGGWYNIALAASKLCFVHPKTGKNMCFEYKPQQTPFDLLDK